jgi:hypothetical protein
MNQKGTRVAMSSIQKQAVINSDQEEDEKAERRIGVDRRQFSYSAYIPERRSGGPRRKKTGPDESPDSLKSPVVEK